MAQLYNMFSFVAFVLAALAFILAVIFWFVFRIPKIIGDLSGRTAHKSIERMRKENESAGKQAKVVYNPPSGSLAPSEELEATEPLATEPLATVPLDAFMQNIKQDLNQDLNQEDLGTVVLEQPNGEKLSMIQDIIIVHTK